MSDQVMVDPMLDSISASGGTSQGISATEANQFWINASLWNQIPGNQMQFFDRKNLNDPGSDTRDINQENRQPSNTSTATSSTNRTRSSSPTSTRQTRKRSMASSRSSIPSINSASPDNNQKAGRVRQQPSRQRKQSEKLPSSTSQRKEERVKQEPGVEEDDSKRNRFLERNRVAASKCRQKKKEWVNDLEETKHDLESRNNSLQMEHNALVLELTRMKNHLMTHANCNDPNIDQWIENEARKFVQNTSGLFDNIRPSGAGAGVGSHRNRNGAVVQHSRNNSIGAHLPSPHSREEEINFDHMPDGLFDDKPLA